MSGDHIHPEPTTFLRKHVFSHDHKVIAKQFLWFGLIWLLIGGVIDPAAYNMLFTMHGTIMIFLGLTPVLIGFGG
jgi:cytochrome c oxidase subunit 1